MPESTITCCCLLARPVVLFFQKAVTVRTAVATARVQLPPGHSTDCNGQRQQQWRLTSQLAGIRAAKMTSLLIPLCHNINLSQVRVLLLESSLQPCA